MSATAAIPMPDAPRLGRSPLVRLRQLLAVIRLNLHLMLREKRIWIVGLLLALPTFIPIGHKIVSMVVPNVPSFPPATMVFENLVKVAYLRVMLYVLALVYGLALINDDVESKTLVHYLLRPLPRWVMVVGRFLASWLVSAVLLVISVVATHALLFAVQPGPITESGIFGEYSRVILWKDSLILVYALGAYLALFGMVGAWLPHAERYAVIFAFGWESLITYFPARLKWMTLMHHVQTLFPHDVNIFGFFSLRGEPLAKPTCVLILACVIVASLALAILNVKRREIK